MCGIAGIVDFNSESANLSFLKEMTDSISSRGPDDFGYFESRNVGFGFRRLSIIDIENGHQPMTARDERIALIFNGEIYNFREIKKTLQAKGHKFTTQSDTEVLINSYIEWGEKCVAHLKGMFAFAVYDRDKEKVFIARDRLGIKPLYYSRTENGLVFASEMKAILKDPAFKRQANLNALSSYLTFRYPVGDQPVFENIKRLLPGHSMTITPSGVSFNKYWEIPFYEKKEDYGEKYYLNKVEELLTKAVERRLVSDVPLGALLSGGLDSSLVVALMKKLTTGEVRTYSIGFDKEGYDESSFAEIVAKHCGTTHTALTLGQHDYMASLLETIRIKDAPLSIPHEIALLQICKELKKHTTVVISGEGADELFGGYGRVQRSPMDYKKIKFIKEYVPRPLQNIVMKVMGGGSNSPSLLALRSQMEHFFSVYNWVPFEEKWSLFSNDTLNIIQNDKSTIEFWQRDFEHVKGGDPYDQILYMFEKNHLICLLDRLDTMSMAAGVEARVPFVDHELVEFVSTIPIKYKLKWKSPAHKFGALFQNSFQASESLDDSKHILRKLSEKYLPHEISYRKKKGFPVPLDSWIKDGMSVAAKEILLDKKTRDRGIFNTANLETLINNRQELDYDFWGKKIWMLMNVELWYREFID